MGGVEGQHRMRGRPAKSRVPAGRKCLRVSSPTGPPAPNRARRSGCAGGNGTPEQVLDQFSASRRAALSAADSAVVLAELGRGRSERRSSSAAVPSSSGCAVPRRLDPLETVLGERQGAKEGRPDGQRMDRRADVVANPGSVSSAVRAPPPRSEPLPARAPSGRPGPARRPRQGRSARSRRRLHLSGILRGPR